MFPSVKSAIGWYAAFRKGPKLAQLDMTPRVQEARHVDDATAHCLASILATIRAEYHVSPESLCEWASRSDGAADRPRSQVLGALKAALLREGLIDPPTRAVPIEPHTFIDLNTGLPITTKRAKQ